MQSYVIKPYKTLEKAKMNGANHALPDKAFSLLVITQEEWDKIPEILLADQADAELAQFKQIAPVLPQTESPQGEVIGIVPVIIHLCPDVHYVCYRDLGDQALEVGIRFFLTPKRFILLRQSKVAMEEISRWAQRGILSAPLDLAGALASQVLGHYRVHAEQMEDKMYRFEADIVQGPLNKHHLRIMTLHRQIAILQRAINYHQAIFARFEEINNFQPCRWMDGLEAEADRTLDTIEHTHELVENLRDAYQTAVQNYTNDVMKILTILATVLLPISLLTGFLGMNFVTLPLIKSPNGMIYFYVLSAIIILIAFIYFWKRRMLHVRHSS